MVWLLVGILICAIVIIAGRAHSRYLDRIEAKWGVVVQIQLLSVPPEIVKHIENATFSAEETRQQLPVEVSRNLDSILGQTSGSAACCSAQHAEPRLDGPATVTATQSIIQGDSRLGDGSTTG